MSTSISTRTPAQAKAWLIAHGISVTDLARKHSIPCWAFYDVLDGRRIGRRGQAHTAAVILGIKPKPSASRLAEV